MPYLKAFTLFLILSSPSAFAESPPKAVESLQESPFAIWRVENGWQGSGFFIRPDPDKDPVFVTNAHVAWTDDSLDDFYLNQDLSFIRFKADKLLGIDFTYDIAILTVKPDPSSQVKRKTAPYYLKVSTTPLTTNEKLTMIGYPGYSFTRVNGTNKNSSERNNTFYVTNFSMDFGGSSGSPIMNSKGQVVGVNAKSNTDNTMLFFSPFKYLTDLNQLITANKDDRRRCRSGQTANQCMRIAFTRTLRMALVAEGIKKEKFSEFLKLGKDYNLSLEEWARIERNKTYGLYAFLESPEENLFAAKQGIENARKLILLFKKNVHRHKDNPSQLKIWNEEIRLQEEKIKHWAGVIMKSNQTERMRTALFNKGQKNKANAEEQTKEIGMKRLERERKERLETIKQARVNAEESARQIVGIQLELEKQTREDNIERNRQRKMTVLESVNKSLTTTVKNIQKIETNIQNIQKNLQTAKTKLKETQQNADKSKKTMETSEWEIKKVLFRKIHEHWKNKITHWEKATKEHELLLKKQQQALKQFQHLKQSLEKQVIKTTMKKSLWSLV